MQIRVLCVVGAIVLTFAALTIIGQRTPAKTSSRASGARTAGNDWIFDGRKIVKPEKEWKKILTYHVVAGNADSKSILKAIKKGGGKAEFKTVSGGTLTALLEGSNVVLMDEKGGKSIVTTADVRQSNGVIHVIDSVVLPN